MPQEVFGYNREEDDIKHDDHHAEVPNQDDSDVLPITEVRANEIVILCTSCCDA